MNIYRILKRGDFGYEPQIKYNMGARGGKKWFPLSATGHWLEPDAFSHGNIAQHLVFKERSDAERVVTRAKAINGEHIKPQAAK